jgi:ATP-dependent exoDNAse (exonuclease V) alpha subunit
MSIKEKAIKNQKEVIEAVCRDLERDRASVLTGGAGYGKTYVCHQIIEKMSRERDEILICALSHKAATVAAQMMEGKGGVRFQTHTNASAVHAKGFRDENGGLYFKPVDKYKIVNGRRVLIPPPISLADIIICDECSQISQSDLDMINRMRKPDSKLLFVGDNCQLPPISEDEGSPVFKNFKVNSLLYPFRFEGNLAIFAEAMRKEVQKGLEGKKFDPYLWKAYINELPEMVFFDYSRKREFNDAMITAFKKDDASEIKYIGYHNQDTQRVSSYIRDRLRGKSVPPFSTGDFVVAHSNYYNNSGVQKIKNSEELFITGKRAMRAFLVFMEDFDGVLRYYELNTSPAKSKASVENYYKEMATFNVNVEAFEMKYWSQDFSNGAVFVPTTPLDEKLLKKVKDSILKNGTHSASPHESKGQAFGALEEFFCPIQYGYALTSHKVQGSTLKTCFVNLRDIYGSTKTSDLLKLRSAYVALSRATDKNYILY